MLHRYTFGTKSDWLPGIEVFESTFDVKYVEKTFHDVLPIKEYLCLRDIPNFGFQPKGDQVISGTSYLALPRDVKVNYRTIKMANGSTTYKTESEGNPLGVKVQLGGWYNSQCLIGGEVAVYSWSPTDEPFYKDIVRIFTKGFVGIHDWQKRRWWIGPEAMQALRDGKRLIVGAVSAPDTLEDIHLPDNMR
ncbi:MAG: hypothetical protein ABJA67_16980 [Chthonomonadales bacterium]